MKNLLLILLLIPFFGYSTTYFVANAGNDANSGTSSGSPWQTIGKVNATSFNPGDIVQFNRGDVFIGTLLINQSGTSGSPIIFGAYGSGANPVITGFTQIHNWLSIGSHLYTSVCSSCQLDLNAVTFSDTLTSMGRYPALNGTINGGYRQFQTNSAPTSLTSNQIASDPNFDSGEVVVRVNDWQLDRYRITNQTSNVVTFFPRPGAQSFFSSNNAGFFFENSPAALAKPGDWCYDSANKLITIYSTTGADTANVKAATNSYLVKTGQSYLTFQNITFNGSDSSNIHNTGNNNKGVSILNCTIKNGGISGADQVIQTDSAMTFKYDSILNCYAYGIKNNFDPGLTVDSCYISNIGMVAGMGQCGSTSLEAIQGVGHKALIEYNTIYKSGYIGIHFYNDSLLIYHNFCDSTDQIVGDGGSIYTFADSSSYGRIIRGNIVLNCGNLNNKYGASSVSYPFTNPYETPPCHGIYIDQGGSHLIIDSNYVQGSEFGGLEINAQCHDIQVLHNTFFDNHYDQFDLAMTDTNQTNIIFKYNALISRRADQLSYQIDNTGWIAYDKMGFFDSNYLCRPIDEPTGINTAGYPGGNTNWTLPSAEGGIVATLNGNNFYSLDTWKTLSGQDAHTVKTFSSASISGPYSSQSYHLSPIYNPTNNSETVSLPPGTFFDVHGTSYSGNISIPAYGSLVLMQTPLGVDPSIVSPGEYYPLIRDQYSGTEYDLLNVVPELTPGQPAFISQVIGGAHDGFVLDNYGQFYPTGTNNSGEWGNGTTTGGGSFVNVANDSLGASLIGTIQVLSTGNNSGGFWSTWLLNNAGQVRGAGETEGGMRGDGTPGMTAQTKFVQVPYPAGTFITKIQGAAGLIVALDSSGNVWTHGAYNNAYELMRGSTPSPAYTSPGKCYTASGGVRAIDIASVGLFTHILLSNGHILAGGGQYMGYYFGGPVSASYNPQDVTALLNLPHTPVHIWSNDETTYAILTDGTLWAWGGTAVGTVGTGQQLNFAVTGPNNGLYAWNFAANSLQQIAPVQIAPGKTNFTNVYVGYTVSYYTYATDSYGQLFSFGRGKAGVLGNGVEECNPISGAITALYPDSWNHTLPIAVSPIGVTAAVKITCPYCIISPSSSPCNGCTITPPTPPHASVTNQTLPAGPVVLNGLASTSHYFQYITWTQLTGPATAQLGIRTSLTDTTTLNTAGTYTFKMVITDSTWQSDSAVSTIVIGAVSGCPNCVFFPRSTIVVYNNIKYEKTIFDIIDERYRAGREGSR